MGLLKQQHEADQLLRAGASAGHGTVTWGHMESPSSLQSRRFTTSKRAGCSCEDGRGEFRKLDSIMHESILSSVFALAAKGHANLVTG